MFWNRKLRNKNGIWWSLNRKIMRSFLRNHWINGLIKSNLLWLLKINKIVLGKVSKSSMMLSTTRQDRILTIEIVSHVLTWISWIIGVHHLLISTNIDHIIELSNLVVIKAIFQIIMGKPGPPLCPLWDLQKPTALRKICVSGIYCTVMRFAYF